MSNLFQGVFSSIYGKKEILFIVFPILLVACSTHNCPSVPIPLPQEWREFKYPQIHLNDGPDGKWCSDKKEIMEFIGQAMRCDEYRQGAINILDEMMK
jgi:hypothetical protein